MERQTTASPAKERNKERHAIILKWWKALREKRGVRARLRRCSEPGEVLMHAAFYELQHEVQPYWPPGQDMMLALAAVAGLLSHVQSIDPGSSLPEKLGKPKTEGGKPPMSEMRFRELIKSRNWPEYYSRMRRALLMLDRTADPHSLIELTLQFAWEHIGEVPSEPGKRFQFRMANDYFKSSFKR